jgi:hypothetical protein
MDRANPTLEQMAQHWFYFFGTNPSVESFAHSRARFLYFQTRGLGNVCLINSGCFKAYDQRSGVVLQPHPGGVKGAHHFGDNGRGCVLSEGEVKVTDKVVLKCVALVKSLGFNLLSVSRLLDEGFEVLFKSSASWILDARGDLVCMVVPEGQILRADFPSVQGFLGVLWLVLLVSCGSGTGGWVT